MAYHLFNSVAAFIHLHFAVACLLTSYLVLIEWFPITRGSNAGLSIQGKLVRIWAVEPVVAMNP